MYRLSFLGGDFDVGDVLFGEPDIETGMLSCVKGGSDLAEVAPPRWVFRRMQSRASVSRAQQTPCLLASSPFPHAALACFSTQIVKVAKGRYV